MPLLSLWLCSLKSSQISLRLKKLNRASKGQLQQNTTCEGKGTLLAQGI